LPGAQRRVAVASSQRWDSPDSDDVDLAEVSVDRVGEVLDRVLVGDVADDAGEPAASPVKMATVPSSL
jgi:hypothetical protein